MELKLRLQRVLQILEDAERSGAMSELEKDMVLAELREAYSDVKFGVVACETQEENEVIAPVLPTPEPEPTPAPEVEETEAEDDEPEMEVEIIFNEEDDDEEEVETEIEAPIETPTVVEQPVVEEPAVEAPAVVEAPEEVVVYEAPAEEEAEEETEEETEVEEQPIVEEKVEEPVVTEPIVEEKVEPIVEEKVEKTVVAEELSSLHAPHSTPAHSAILSLYDDAPAVIGEQFRETTSVADTIVCPKGVAEATPITSLRSAIGVADKFMFVRELFGGNDEAYEAAITALESQPSFDDCIIHISENYVWAPNNEATKLMMELLQRKYNA